MQAFAMKERGESFLRLVEKMREVPEDIRFSDIRNNVEPAFTFYKLGAGIPLFHGKDLTKEDKAILNNAGRDAFNNTHMIMTDTGISLVHKEQDLFIIDRGMPFVTTGNNPGTSYKFNAEAERFTFGYLYQEPMTSTMALVMMIMVYDMDNIHRAYSQDIKYGSPEFYEMAREGLFTHIDITLMKSQKAA
jgi:hypothetical protein